MASLKPAAKILRVLGPKDDAAWERTLIGIYDYIDGLTTTAFRQSEVISTPIADVAAYTTIATVGFPFTKRRIANFAGPFLITDDVVNARTNIDVGLFSSSIKGLTPASGGGSTNFLRADGVWSAPAGGITQLTGDVTAGPGTGSQVATLANIPNAVPAAGSIVFTKIAAPAAPAAGKIRLWADTATDNVLSEDEFGIVSCMVVPFPAQTSKWLRSVGTSGVFTATQPAFSDISGVLAGSQFGPLTGDVTTSGYVATLASIPNATPALGSILRTNIAAPATPAAGKAHVYVDSTSLNLAAKNASGVVNHGIQTRGATTSQWIRSIADDGTSGISQPAFSDIAGTSTLAQLPNGSALSVLGRTFNSSGVYADISASAASGFALRESGSSLGFGTLATAAYANQSVTYAKIQNASIGPLFLGRAVGSAGTIQEMPATGAVQFGASSVFVPRQVTMTWGGLLGSIGTQLATSSFYLGIGDNSWSTSSLFGFHSPVGSGGGGLSPASTQDWSIIIFANTLAGTGSPTFDVSLMVAGAAVLTLHNYAGSAGVPTGHVGSTTQVFTSLQVLGIRISVASGTINAGNLGIYVVLRYTE